MKIILMVFIPRVMLNWMPQIFIFQVVLEPLRTLLITQTVLPDMILMQKVQALG